MPFNRKTLEVTTSTDNPVITVGDMADFLRHDEAGDNAIIEAYIEEATEAVKEYLRVAIKTETMVYRADRFADYSGDDRMARMGPGVHTASKNHILGSVDKLDLPFPPLQSVTSVTTYDTSNSSSVYSSDNYTVDLQGGRIYLDEGASWPSNLRDTNAVEVEYVAGYGSGSVPEPIVGAIRKYVMNVFDGCAGLSDEVRRDLSPYRITDELAW